MRDTRPTEQPLKSNLAEVFMPDKPAVMQPATARLAEPHSFLSQFDFQCKYNKGYNRYQDCQDYMLEMKKEV